MIIKQVRLSQQAKDQLSRLKGKTGITGLLPAVTSALVL